MHYINPHITNRISNIVKGTILGGSSLVKSKSGKKCYLSMRGKNGFWLDFKSAELKVFSSDTPVTIEKTNRWHSLCYPYFDEIRPLFYTDQKRHLNIDVLNGLRDIAYMIWYGDAGSYKNNQITFNTHIWGEQGTETINRYFNEIGFSSEIVLKQKYFRVRLDETSSKQILKIISPHFPNFFQL